MALVGTSGICPWVYKLPDGVTTLPVPSAATTSSGEKLWARRRSGSTVMTIARVLLPNGEKATVPWNLADQQRADAVKAQIGQLTQRPGLAFQNQVADGDVGRVKSDHEGRQHAGRHLPPRTVRQADHLRHGRRHVRARIESQLQQDEVLDVLRFDPLEPVYVLEVLLVDVRNDPLDLARVHAGVVVHHVDLGCVDRREDVDPHLVQRQHAAANQRHDNHHQRDRPPHCENGKIHRRSPSSVIHEETTLARQCQTSRIFK